MQKSLFRNNGCGDNNKNKNGDNNRNISLLFKSLFFAVFIFFSFTPSGFFFSNNSNAAAVPQETSHSNTNTYTNLNTITNTENITFTITYDIPGDIKWYKDGTLIQTDTNTNTATLTTNWTADDYTQVKELKVNSTTIDGTSTDTLWKVEVQETGTATIAKHTAYPQFRIDGQYTLYITNGWTNLPSLYLAAKQEDDVWIEYVSTKKYILKKSVLMNDSTLNITSDTVREIKMSSNHITKIMEQGNSTVNIDKVNIFGWDIVNGRETLKSEVSPTIMADGDNTLNLTNSNFRHVRIFYNVDRSEGDIIDNNTFFEGNDANIRMIDGYGENTSRGQIFTDNYFLDGQSQNYYNQRYLEAPGMLLKNNKFISHTAGNILLPQNTEFIGNEVVHSDWNLIEFPNNSFAKYNNLHDNGGHHNGFNGTRNSYLYNDYCHDFTGYACYFLQVAQPNIDDPLTWYASSRGYIINGYTKDATGINILGGIDNYFYNFTADNSANNIQYTSDRNIYRRSSFSNSNPAIKLVDPTDVDLNDYGYVLDTYVIDSQFSYTNGDDVRFESSISNGGHPIFNSINSFRKNSDNSLQIPKINIYNVLGGGEARNYAYLDTLVQDQNGSPVEGATVTVTPYAMAPVFSVASGSYTASQGISASSATPGAVIHYTVDGTDPTVSSPVFPSSLSISSTTTLKAMAVKDGYVDSNISSATYTITAAAETLTAAPVLSLAPGFYFSDQGVTITSTTPDATIYYTLTDSAPTTASTVYTGPIYLTRTTVVRAMAVAPGFAQSGEVKSSYAVYTPVIYSESFENYPVLKVTLPPPPPDLDSYPVENLSIPTIANFDSIQTRADGHTPAPNYGWSANDEATPALLFYRQTRGSMTNINTTGYQYRITATYNSQSVSTVVVPDDTWLREDPNTPAKTIVLTFDKPTNKVALNVNNGTGSGIYTAGDSVTITAGAAPSGKIFSKWIGDTTGIADTASSSTTMIVPSGDASVSAYYVDITYHLTVVGGEGSGDYPAGKIVVADASAVSGEQVFYKWTGTGAPYLLSPMVYSSTLAMPATNITVTATYREDPSSYSCHLTVADGEGSDFYVAGDNVTISADDPLPGQAFDHWAGDVENVADINTSVTTLASIPDGYSIVYPVYKSLSVTAHHLTITGGTIAGGYYEAGTSVAISAQSPLAGKTFDAWTGDTAYIADPSSLATTITMPGVDVTVIATYKDLPTYALTVTNGSGSGSYFQGKALPIIADTAPSGKIFDKWAGDIQYVSDISLSHASVLMPAAAVNLTAAYKNIPVVSTPSFSVSGGSYAAAQIVVITSATSGANIYYTTDGSTPTSNSALYTAPITVSSSKTLKAVALRTGYGDSIISSAAYTINISSGGSSGGSSGSTSSSPKINQLTVTKTEGNNLTLSLNVTNASKMMLSDNNSFTNTNWITFDSTYTYTKQDNQNKLYIKFKSSTNITSPVYELTLKNGETTGNNTDSPYPNGTLIKIPTSFKTYVMIDSKKKWIPTPEVFEQLGYQWTNIQELTPEQLNNIPDYEDNLIRALNDYKVYLVVNGVKRHIPNPQVFLNYGFDWNDVKDVPQATIDQYQNTYLIKASNTNDIYYINTNQIRKIIPTTAIFNSYNDKQEDIQIISQFEMDYYPNSNLIRQSNSNDIYLIEGNTKKRIPNPTIFNRYHLNWNHIMTVNQTEFDYYINGGELS